MTRVVVVEDDRLTRDLLVLLLRADVDVVAAFSSADAAMEWAGWDRVDALLTDLRLRGGADGATLNGWVRERWPNVRRVLVSGRDLSDDDVAEFDAFVSKSGMLHDRLLDALGVE